MYNKGGPPKPSYLYSNFEVYDLYGNFVPELSNPSWMNPPEESPFGTGLPDVEEQPPEEETKSTGSRRYYGSGGGGGGGSMSQSEIFFDWFGRYPTASEKAVMENEGWNEGTIRKAAVGAVTRQGLFLNADGYMLDRERSRVAIALAPWFGGIDNVPSSMIDGFVGDNADSDYLSNVYGPRLKGVSADNPLVADFINTYVGLTGRVPGEEALDKLEDFIGSYGVTDTAMAAWENWVKTTPAAITGNYGAEHRAGISNIVNSILGRPATEAELNANNSWWNLSDAALLEQLRSTPEYTALYGDKPAWVTEADYINARMGLEYVLRWAYGDRVTLNPDGSLTFPVGPYGENLPTEPTPATTTVEQPAPERPAWKSLTYTTFNQELAKVGITVVSGEGPTGTYKDSAGNAVGWDQLVNYLPTDQFYKDAQGYHYIQEPGAINPTNQQEVPGWDPEAAAPDNMVSPTQGYQFTYTIPEMVNDMIRNNYTPEMIMQEIRWGEEADYLSGVYSEVVIEAFGSTGGIDWYTMASGAIGSGAMRAQLMQAQNRVAYREAYRQVFGTDPSPADYDRITSEFVSPGELLREHQAIESADEMYAEVNELLGRVYGQSVTKEELKDMVLGRPNSGELRALINQATKLDQYRWVHKQHFDTEPTPDDYAQYAGYAGVAELQWEIVTKERIAEMGPQIQEAFRRAYDYELSDDDLQTMLGEQEGYGDLRRMYEEAQEKVQKQETAVRLAHEEEKLEIGYSKAPLGGFQATLQPLAEL